MAKNSQITGGLFNPNIDYERVAKMISMTASNCNLLYDHSIKTIKDQSREYNYHHKHLSLLVRHMEYFIIQPRVSKKLTFALRKKELMIYAIIFGVINLSR